MKSVAAADNEVEGRGITLLQMLLLIECVCEIILKIGQHLISLLSCDKNLVADFLFDHWVEHRCMGLGRFSSRR